MGPAAVFLKFCKDPSRRLEATGYLR
jgi:hypothetical protein